MVELLVFQSARRPRQHVLSPEYEPVSVISNYGGTGFQVKELYESSYTSEKVVKNSST